MFYKVDSFALKNINHDNIPEVKPVYASKNWKYCASGLVNGAFLKKNSSSKLIKSIPAKFRPRVLVQCNGCGSTNCQIQFQLNHKYAELQPGLYNLDNASDRDLHKLLKDANALKTEKKVLKYIETMFSLCNVTLKTCCLYPIQSKVQKNVDTISAAIMEESQPISVKDLKISEVEINAENRKLLKMNKKSSCSHTEEPCFEKDQGLSGYSNFIEIISSVILLEVDTYPNDTDLVYFNGAIQAIKRYFANHDGDKVTLILSYNVTQRSGHAIISSWEIGSNELYIMDTAAPKVDEVTSTLTLEIKKKIERALRVLGITKINYGTDGLGNGVVSQNGNTCAATCLTIALFIGAGATVIPKLSERFVRQMACKMRQLSAKKKQPTIPRIISDDFNSFLSVFLQLS
jgi:hypothetical protein